MVNFFSKVYLRGRADPESIWKALSTWDKDIQYFYSIKTKTTSPKRAIIPIQHLVQQEVLSQWPSQLYSPSHISSYSEPLPQAWLGNDVAEEQGCERFPFSLIQVVGEEEGEDMALRLFASSLFLGQVLQKGWWGGKYHIAYP